MGVLKRIILLVVLALTAVLVPASAQQPGKRVALIIANSAYVGQPRLVNPQTDAALLKPALERAGFQVDVASNVTRVQLTEALTTFRRKTDGAQVALIYFAGHGLRDGDFNWMLPVDFEASDISDDPDNRGFNLFAKSHADFFNALGTARVRLAVFDACRNNPFASRLPTRAGTRAVGGTDGLGEFESRAGVMLLSAEAGRLANDGEPGRGSPFARAFAEQIATPNEDLSLVLRRVSTGVMRETAGGRNPQRPKILGIENLGDQPVVLVVRASVAVPPLAARTAAETWRATSQPTLRLTLNHEASLLDAEWSPDGSRIVTADRYGTARVWDARTGQSLLILTGHEGEVRSAAFSPDGARIVTGSPDKTARVWDARSGKSLLTLTGRQVLSAAYSPDGTRILTGNFERTASVWDASTGRSLLTLTGHQDGVLSAAFSPDGTRILTGSYDQTARVWDARRGQSVLTLAGHKGWVRSVAFSRDGALIVTASRDGTARVWDARTGQSLLILTGHEGEVRSAAFSPDGARIVTGGDDGTARVWDARSGQSLLILTRDQDGDYYTVTTAAFSPDGTRILTGGDDDTALVWGAE